MKATARALLFGALIATLAAGVPASSRCIYVDVNGDGINTAGVLVPSSRIANPSEPRTAIAANPVTATPPGSELPVAQPPANTPRQTYAANAYVTDENRVVRLYSQGRAWSAELEAVSAFQVTDIVPSSITASFGGMQVHAIGMKNVVRQGTGDAPRIAGVFWKGDLIALFAGLPDGRQTVDVLLSGNVGPRGSFRATVSVVVEKETKPVSGKGRVQASPNPFNPSTTISFELAKAGRVRARVFDVAGRLVSTLVDRDMAAGPQEVRWDGVGRNGSRLPSGVYFYVLETPERTVKNVLVMAK